MAKHTSPMRLNETLVNEAQVVAASMNRTAAEQIEFWSEIGKRVSANLSQAQIMQLISGSSKVVLEEAPAYAIDVFALANEVGADSLSGSLNKELLDKGHTLYEPAPESGGVLIATMPDGTTKKGRFVNGRFKVQRQRKLD